MVSHIIDNIRPRKRPPHRARAERGDVRAALDAFRLIVSALRSSGTDAERRTGLTSAQLFALQRIAEHPGASVNEVAALTFTHQSSVSVVIRRLVAKRLVVKVAAKDDRRRQQLELTAAGRRSIARAPSVVQDRLIDAIAALNPRGRRTVTRLLGHIAGQLAPRVAPHPPMLFEEPQRSKRRKGNESDWQRGC